MALINVSEAGEFIMKHGAKAVMLIWIASLQYQIAGITEDYKECMNSRVSDFNNITSESRFYGVIPKKVGGGKKYWKT